MFNYLAKCGWLFDGFFSHWLLNSSFDWQIQRSVEGFSQAARVLPAQGGSPGPQRRLRKSFDRLLSLSIEGWIE